MPPRKHARASTAGTSTPCPTIETPQYNLFACIEALDKVNDGKTLKALFLHLANTNPTIASTVRLAYANHTVAQRATRQGG
jgi:hypothetical protein